MKLDFNWAMAVSLAMIQKAEILLRKQWEAEPRNWRLGWKLGETLRQMGHLDHALQMYEEVLKLRPNCIEAKYIADILSGKEIKKGQEFHSIPVPFMFFEDFLPQAILDLVWKCIHEKRDIFIQSPLQNKVDINYRNSKVLSENALDGIRDKVLHYVHEVLEPRYGQLGLSQLGISKEEIQLTVHAGGGFYNVHQDNAGSAVGFSSRVITYVIYLCREPAQFSGGDLLLFDGNVNADGCLSKFTRILPKNNSIVIFPSEAWHMVTPVVMKNPEFEFGRFTINGWLHNIQTL